MGNPTFEPGGPPDPCPPWWPSIIWDLHYWPKWPGPGPGPINYPPAIQDLMASIAIHTFSYLQLDQKAAQVIRTQAEERIVATAKQLSALHDKGIAQRQKPTA